MMINVPFNWVGNKKRFLGEINNVLQGRSYNTIYDIFMGSGSILFNTETDNVTCVGNDNIKLLPNIYKVLSSIEDLYTLDDVESVLNKNNRFSAKEDYYSFRDYWNNKYLNNIFDRDFVIETILLLKMCSNSMVRFNPKEGYFNQGFRGLGKKEEFFTEGAKNKCVKEINELIIHMKNSKAKYEFTNCNFANMIVNSKKGDLLVLDPPYILEKEMYDTTWTKECDDKLFDMMENTDSDFIYFNYLERDGVVNDRLQDFIHKNNLRVININSKTQSGQGRSGVVDIKEVIVTNIR